VGARGLLARLLVVGGIGAVVLAATAAPAAAHGVGGVRPTNYQTRILSVRPEVPGITVRTVDLGDRLEVENRTRRDVVVLGYDDEPYLRIGPRGTFENVRSPATYVNRTRRGGGPVPASADPEAPPEWRRISDEPVARWHDHRAHWMRPDEPPAVQRDPDRTHVLQRFRVEIVDGDRSIIARGDVRWVPAPSPWPWLALAAVAGIGLIAASRTGHAATAVAIALGLVVVVEVVHLAGSWGATTLGVGTRLGASIYGFGAAVVSAIALVWVVRRGLHAAAPLVLIAGLFVAIAGGLADFSVLTRSQVPTTVPDAVARAGVALALGIGIGLTVVGALRLRPSPRPRASVQRSAADGAGAEPMRSPAYSNQRD